MYTAQGVSECLTQSLKSRRVFLGPGGLLEALDVLGLDLLHLRDVPVEVDVALRGPGKLGAGHTAAQVALQPLAASGGKEFCIFPTCSAGVLSTRFHGS